MFRALSGSCSARSLYLAMETEMPPVEFAAAAVEAAAGVEAAAAEDR